MANEEALSIMYPPSGTVAHVGKSSTSSAVIYVTKLNFLASRIGLQDLVMPNYSRQAAWPGVSSQNLDISVSGWAMYVSNKPY